MDLEAEVENGTDRKVQLEIQWQQMVVDSEVRLIRATLAASETDSASRPALVTGLDSTIVASFAHVVDLPLFDPADLDSLEWITCEH